MDIEELILELRNRINEFRKTELYKNTIPLKFDVSAIEIAINLTELGVYNSRAILKSEEYWFEGEYLIQNDFTGYWENISILYSQLVDVVKGKKFYRK
jgi:hypothetical protein